MHVVVIIADIVASRRIGGRPEFQRSLKDLLARASDGASSSLLSPYTLTLGDEFQAVYAKVDTLFSDILQILTSVSPVPVRFAICRGELSTDVNRTAALEMDGPAFYGARALMEQLKSEQRSVVRVAVADGSFDPELANAGLRLFANEMERWRSESTLAILNALLLRKTTKQTALELGIGERAVNKNIDGNGLRDLAFLFDIVGRTLGAGLAGRQETGQ